MLVPDRVILLGVGLNVLDGGIVVDADAIDGDLSRDEQIRYFATGNGFLGTSLDYLANIERHFEKLGVIDDDVTTLLHDTRAYIAASG